MAIASIQSVTRWLVLVHRIPSTPRYLRAKMRQRLAAAGAVAMKNSVYLLPHGPEAAEDLQWIAQEIVAGGGDAHLIEGGFVDPAAHEAAVAQCRRARDADYAALVSEARSALAAARGAASAAALAPAHERLSRRFEQIRRLDAFDAPGRAAAEQALSVIAARMARDRKARTRMATSSPDLLRKTWVTRPGVKVDRIASAWFIRRFVDPKARFRFADASAAPRAGEVRFDMAGGEFSHEGNRCTLETLVHRVGLPDAGVGAIAEIVHDIDLKDARFKRPETAGVAALIDGLVRRYPDDADRIEHGLGLFDDLHEALAPAKRKRP